MKVKHFLDSLAYYMLIGDTSGIETPYKSVVHAKREIPVSNCPAEIDNIFYASGGSPEQLSKEEQCVFKNMIERLDERAAPYEIKKTRKRTPSRFSKKMKKNIHGGTWYRVDTDGTFWIGNNRYMIDSQAEQYQPVHTAYGDYYAMDKILYAGGKFYDMNYDEVRVYSVGGLVSYEDISQVWAET